MRWRRSVRPTSTSWQISSDTDAYETLNTLPLQSESRIHTGWWDDLVCDEGDLYGQSRFWRARGWSPEGVRWLIARDSRSWYDEHGG